MDKKIGIITYHDSDNYGSVLQAYALSHYIKGLGADCKIIDYRKDAVKELYSIWKRPTSRNAVLTNIFQIPYYIKLKKRKKNFENFRKNYLPLSNTLYTKQNDLKSGQYDLYIVGSDQVWNIDIVDFDSSYLLDFTEKKKISYAASFGSSVKNAASFYPYKSLFEKFDKITVREMAGKNLCENELGLTADLVCDPVFLLSADEWRKIKSADTIKEDYIFCYFAGGVSKEMEEFSKSLARQNNCKRVVVMFDWHDWNKKDQIKSFESGPMEFISLLDNAKFVCTNSFHGTAFSIILNKQFFVDGNYSDVRIKTLLNISNKNEALINSKEFDEIGESPNSLKELIEFSKKYLDTIIGNHQEAK